MYAIVNINDRNRTKLHIVYYITFRRTREEYQINVRIVCYGLRPTTKH